MTASDILDAELVLDELRILVVRFIFVDSGAKHSSLTSEAGVPYGCFWNEVSNLGFLQTLFRSCR